MTFHPQTISGPSSNVTLLPTDSSLVFEQNQARRAKVSRELEALRSGTCSSVLDVRLSEPPAAYLQWPTLEGLEAFVEKKTEYNKMMGDMITDVETVIREQLVIVEGLERSAELAEERRLQEFQRALERMSPAEAEIARRAERERASRRQRECVARAAKLDADWEREKARLKLGAESPYDSAEE